MKLHRWLRPGALEYAIRHLDREAVRLRADVWRIRCPWCDSPDCVVRVELPEPLIVCGTMFHAPLRVDEALRHRGFDPNAVFRAIEGHAVDIERAQWMLHALAPDGGGQ
jgi:hypothetical protein